MKPHPVPSPATIARYRPLRQQWARPYVAPYRDYPSYGSPEWVALPTSDPRKVAACVVAAECWVNDLEDLPARLAAELETARAIEEAEWRSYVKGLVRHLTNPGVVELGRRLNLTEAERVAEARRPRPTDRMPFRPTDQSGEAA